MFDATIKTGDNVKEEIEVRIMDKLFHNFYYTIFSSL